jgi:hypothetical protein
MSYLKDRVEEEFTYEFKIKEARFKMQVTNIQHPASRSEIPGGR